ncbi:unnamed protein product [marine sediment metagenome]|uniref:Uncharacterized protein n=1 Tax=marine sediment metagenome TaxID=412755 RepID=X1AQ28_9ZZZZ
MVMILGIICREVIGNIPIYSAQESSDLFNFFKGVVLAGNDQGGNFKSCDSGSLGDEALNLIQSAADLAAVKIRIKGFKIDISAVNILKQAGSCFLI